MRSQLRTGFGRDLAPTGPWWRTVPARGGSARSVFGLDEQDGGVQVAGGFPGLDAEARSVRARRPDPHSSVTFGSSPRPSRCVERLMSPPARTSTTGTGQGHDAAASRSPPPVHPVLDHPVGLGPPPGIQPRPVDTSSGQVRALRPLHRAQQRHPSTRRGTSSTIRCLCGSRTTPRGGSGSGSRAPDMTARAHPTQSTCPTTACRAPRTARAGSHLGQNATGHPT